MRKDVEEGVVNRLVVGACSPRVMADKFRFDGVPVVRANLREQVAWSQPPHAEDTEMLAADAIRMAAAQLSKTEQPNAGRRSPIGARSILVVGAGVTGLTAALEAARSGYDVVLVEKSDALGGWSAKWSMRAPHAPPYRDMYANDIDKLIAAVKANSRIRIFTGSVVASTSGQPGAFKMSIARAGEEIIETVGAIVVATGWRPYDATKLGHLGYGASADVVTSVEFEAMLAKGAVKRPSNGAPAQTVAFVQCAGSRDPNHLPYCSSVCCSASIKQALQVVKGDRNASAYIVYEELRTPGTAEEFYREAQRNGVIFMKGKVKSVDGKGMTISYADELLGQDVPLGRARPHRARDRHGSEFDQCRRARDRAGKERRAARRRHQSRWRRSGSPATPKAKARPGRISTRAFRRAARSSTFSTGRVPISRSWPTDFPTAITSAFPTRRAAPASIPPGPLRRPMDMAESAEDATGAVLKAIQAIEGAGAGAAVHPRVGDLTYPKIGHEKCTKCGRCTIECPFGAIDVDEQGRPVVNFGRCRRCGICMGACPVQTITFDNYNPQMVNEMIEANEIPDEFSEKPRILVLACENDAYPAIDMAGIARSHWSPFVRIIPVRCLGSVTLQWVSTALQKGYDGIMLMGCKSGDDYQCHFVKGSALAKERLSKVGETLKSLALEKERVAFEEMSIADSCRAPTVLDAFAKLIGDLPPNPMKGF